MSDAVALRRATQAWRAGDASGLPVAKAGTKRPAMLWKWKQYRDKLATNGEVDKWFTPDLHALGMPLGLTAGADDAA